MREGEEAGSEDDTNGLWNGQPFRPQPAVPIPDCPAGCARAQSLQVGGSPPIFVSTALSFTAHF